MFPSKPRPPGQAPGAISRHAVTAVRQPLLSIVEYPADGIWPISSFDLVALQGVSNKTCIPAIPGGAGRLAISDGSVLQGEIWTACAGKINSARALHVHCFYISYRHYLHYRPRVGSGLSNCVFLLLLAPPGPTNALHSLLPCMGRNMARRWWGIIPHYSKPWRSLAWFLLRSD